MEVSSPGVERPLFTLAQFSEHVGSQVRVHLYAALEGRRKFKGLLQRIEGENIIVEVDGEEHVLPYSSVGKANISVF